MGLDPPAWAWSGPRLETGHPQPHENVLSEPGQGALESPVKTACCPLLPLLSPHLSPRRAWEGRKKEAGSLGLEQGLCFRGSGTLGQECAGVGM